MPTPVTTLYSWRLDALHVFTGNMRRLGTLQFRGDAWRRAYGRGQQVLLHRETYPTLTAAILALLPTREAWLLELSESGEVRSYLAGTGPKPEGESSRAQDTTVVPPAAGPEPRARQARVRVPHGDAHRQDQGRHRRGKRALRAG